MRYLNSEDLDKPEDQGVKILKTSGYAGGTLET